MEQEGRLKYLFQKYIGKSYSAEEKEELFEYIVQAGNAQELKDAIEDTWEGDFLWHEQDEKEADIIFRKVINTWVKSTRPSIISMWKWLSAACIILLLGLGTWWFMDKSNSKPGTVQVAKGNDIPAPQDARAVITLADGSKVYLDSVGNGTLATQGNVKLVKLENGQVAYQTDKGEVLKEMKYNTLNNPRGSKVIDMQLSDGSHVWLNSGSSITYPVAFIGNDRKVEVTGEAYFEVAHNAAKPFVVGKGNVSVQVLGTHFNVNAYDDEASLKVTLLEGSVKVAAGNQSKIITPGQQAQAVKGELSVINEVDLDEVMAWKNGSFSFKSTDIRSIMRQIARWYDVEVKYEGAVANETISGDISRDVNVSQVIKMMEFAGFHFRIDGKTITVLK